MTQESNKVTIEKSVVLNADGTRIGLSEAAKKIYDLVHAPVDQGGLGLSKTDSTTRVMYWDSEQWNAPASIVLAADGKSWNGTFRTHLGTALTMISGARAPRAPQAPSADGSKPARTPTLVKATMVNLNTETGLVVFGLEHAQAVYDCSAKAFTLLDDMALKDYSRKLMSFVENPRGYITAAVELDANGQVMVGGWTYGSYSSAKTDYAQAMQDLLTQAVAKTDWGFVTGDGQGLINGTIKMTKQGESQKDLFLAKWYPEKLPAETPAPGQGSETAPDPSEVKVIDEAITVPQVPVTAQPEPVAQAKSKPRKAVVN